MNNLILLLSIFLLSACTPIDNTEYGIDDYIEVNGIYWQGSEYPFTTSGHILCTSNEVYFHPDDTANDESSIGIPLNKLAAKRLEQAGLIPMPRDTIKPDADLTQAIELGLERCHQSDIALQEFINNR